MRILSLLSGLVIGAGAMIWFYSNGGEISVGGHQWGPAPKTVNVGAGSDAGPGGSKSPPKPRVVVRDITSGATPNSTDPAPTINPPPPGAKPLIVIKWPRGEYVTKFP
jgi:hypothetical protein